MNDSDLKVDVVVGGAGMSGLTAAVELHERGYRVLVVDAAENVGGRVRTDDRGGYLLDRGFQVLLTGYPQVRRLLDYEDLDLRYFPRGATTYSATGFDRFIDPRDDVLGAARSLSAILGAGDLQPLWRLCRLGATDAAMPDTCISDYLGNAGFSRSFREQFLEPFLRGVLLDPELSGPIELLRFYMNTFATGRIALPNYGMGRVPEQLAKRLPARALFLGRRIEGVTPGCISLEGGDSVSCGAFVSALDPMGVASIAGSKSVANFHKTVCHYFSAPSGDVPETLPLLLNGSGRGVINHIAIPSMVSSAYAPPGFHLLSVNEVGTAESAAPVVIQEELRAIYGDVVEGWTYLETISVPQALPSSTDGHAWKRFGEAARQSLVSRFCGPVSIAGDFSCNASMNGAMEAGERAADEVASALRASLFGGVR